MRSLLRPIAAGVAAVSVLTACAIRFFTAGEPRRFDVDCGQTFNATYTGQENDRYVVVTVDNTGVCAIDARTSTGGDEAELMRVEPGKRAVAVTEKPREGGTLTVALHCDGEAETGRCRGTIATVAARRAQEGGSERLTLFTLTRTTLSTGNCDGTRELGSFTNGLASGGTIWIEVTNAGTCNTFKVDVTVDGQTRSVEDMEGGQPTEGNVAIPAGRTATLVARCAASTEANANCAGAVEITLR